MAKNILNVGGYKILKRIGSGARSTIYLATHEETDTTVALKRVLLERPEDSRVFEQVETEYKVARRIDHPYVRKCHSLDRVRSLFKVKELLLSMEYFDGTSLEEGPTLALVDILLIFRMVASGLHAMHSQGYIHCDIKPNNILLNKSGAIKIIDLGQSCRIGATKPRIQGTPDYIAPEQVRRKQLSAQTDIFNLGATMYWALTGKNVPTLIPKRKNGMGLVIPKNCPAPHEIRNKVPVGVSKLIMDCIKDDPADRPRDMTMVISRLDLMIHSILGDKIRTNKNGSNNN
jgi:serine/threonine-protein kinase